MGFMGCSNPPKPGGGATAWPGTEPKFGLKGGQSIKTNNKGICLISSQKQKDICLIDPIFML